MGPRRGAAIALASGVGVLAVLGVGIIFRTDIAAAWHLHRLRTDEGHLARIIDAPEGSAADLAIRRHLQSADGKNAMFLLHAAAMSTHTGLPFLSNDHACRGVLWTGERHLRTLALCEGKNCGGTRPIADIGRLLAAARYLPLLEGTEFRWPSAPMFRFHVLPASRAPDLLGQPNLELANAGPWVWWFKRLPRPSAALAR